MDRARAQIDATRIALLQPIKAYTSGAGVSGREKPYYHNSSEADTDAVKPDTREFGCPCLAG